MMLRSTKDLENYTISATDGEIGHVKDLYFDDDSWVVRYLVVDTGPWLSSRLVLISPISVRQVDTLEESLSVALTKERVKNSPGIDTDKPVSRQKEEQTLGYYGYPYYWGSTGLWDGGLYPYAMDPAFTGYGLERMDRVAREREDAANLRAEQARHRNDDPHLRSCNAVKGYHIVATDGEIGHVAGYLIDDETWAVRYLVVDTSNWWVGHKMLVAPEWITGVHWSNETVSVGLTRASMQAAPHYDPSVVWSRELDQNLYGHYGRSRYWADSDILETSK